MQAIFFCDNFFILDEFLYTLERTLLNVLDELKYNHVHLLENFIVISIAIIE